MDKIKRFINLPLLWALLIVGAIIWYNGPPPGGW